VRTILCRRCRRPAVGMARAFGVYARRAPRFQVSGRARARATGGVGGGSSGDDKSRRRRHGRALFPYIYT